MIPRRKMKKKHVWGLVLCIAAMSVFAGCGSGTGQSQSTPDTAEEVIEETAAVETEQETGGAEEAVNETITVTECDVSSLNAQPVTEGEYALNEDIKYMLGQLETDYNKVNWDSEFVPFKDSTVFSAASYDTGNDTYYYILAITNLGPEPITVSGEGHVKGEDGQNIGDLYLFADCIGSANTYVTSVYCSDIPNGEVEWTSLKEEPASVYQKYVPWEADWTVENDPDSEIPAIRIVYDIYANETFDTCILNGLVLNEDGKIVDTFTDFVSEPTSEIKSSVSTYKDYSSLGVTDMALFANTIKNNY